MPKVNKTIFLALVFFFTYLLSVAGCSMHYEGRENIEKEEKVVDCLLPGQIRKLGQQMTYLTPQRFIKTTAEDCKVRGGEIKETKEVPNKETYSNSHLNIID